MLRNTSSGTETLQEVVRGPAGDMRFSSSWRRVELQTKEKHMVCVEDGAVFKKSLKLTYSIYVHLRNKFHSKSFIKMSDFGVYSYVYAHIMFKW